MIKTLSGYVSINQIERIYMLDGISINTKSGKEEYEINILCVSGRVYCVERFKTEEEATRMLHFLLTKWEPITSELENMVYVDDE